jgi:starch phosphorylase
MEASGTGNMKLALNGALTIGTLDGANIEISESVGAENIFIFGLRAQEVEECRRRGLDASETIAASPYLPQVLQAIAEGMFSPDDRGRFVPVAHALRHADYYMLCADFDAYFETQRKVDALWLSASRWNRASALNIAHMGWFSADRAIREYAAEIWNVPFDLNHRATKSSPRRH